MRATEAIVRLPPRLLEVARNHPCLHVMQDGAMEEEGMAHSTLRVTRNFHFADRQIADTPKGRSRLPSMERAGDTFEDELIGAPDVREVRMQVEGKHERIGETSRSLEDGTSAARPPEDRDAVLFAGDDMHVVIQAAGPSQHHEVAVALPKSEHGIAALFVQFVQQRLIQGKILGRRGQGQIEQAKPVHLMAAWR